MVGKNPKSQIKRFFNGIVDRLNNLAAIEQLDAKKIKDELKIEKEIIKEQSIREKLKSSFSTSVSLVAYIH
ncbi:MAG: hypothetical protein ABH824_04680 [Nanoarchaeota archaeon]|nr:hypothetical protein [Nanoarchaeota archaeon]MBU1875598.1 hypothetical protein [Nanoarchaeota archaeon]